MIIIEHRISKTKNSTIEHTEIFDGLELVAHGRYTWINRPWQRFTYVSSLYNALNKLYPLKGDRDLLKSLIDVLNDSSDISQATIRIQNILNKED